MELRRPDLGGWVLALTAGWLISVGACYAQSPATSLRDPLNLVRAKPVVEELGVDAGQMEQIARIKQEATAKRKSHLALGKPGPTKSEADRSPPRRLEVAEGKAEPLKTGPQLHDEKGHAPPRMDKAAMEAAKKEQKRLEAERRKISREAEDALRETLTAAQWKRLEEIRLQLRGDSVLADPDIQLHLGFSLDQLDGVEKARKEVGTKLLALMKERAKDAKLPAAQRKPEKEWIAGAEKIRAEGRRKLAELLLPQQKADYEKLRGEPFDFRRLTAR